VHLPIGQDGVSVRDFSEGRLPSRARVSDYRKLAEEHLVYAEAAVAPGIQVKKDLFIRLKLRSAKRDAPLGSDLPARLFENDLSLADTAFDNFPNAQGYVRKNPALLLVEAAGDGKDFAPDDSPRADYQIIVGRGNECGGKRGV